MQREKKNHYAGMLKTTSISVRTVVRENVYFVNSVRSALSSALSPSLYLLIFISSFLAHWRLSPLNSICLILSFILFKPPLPCFSHLNLLLALSRCVINFRVISHFRIKINAKLKTLPNINGMRSIFESLWPLLQL